MKINPQIFKSYDIRGIYPQELNEETAYFIGKALVNYIQAQKIIVGRDARLSGDELMNFLIKGMRETGADVINIGQVLTECLYFSVANYNVDGGVMITASHNPKEYNGFKMLKKKGEEIFVIRGKDFLPLISQEIKAVERRGELSEKDIWHDYLSYLLKFFDLSKILPFRVVVDTSNGVGAKAILAIEDKLPIEIIPLNFELDGNFPNHSPNPLEPDSISQISQAIQKEKADFGVIFDGDGDRIFLLDENGKMVSADITLLIIAKYLLEQNPHSSIIYNVICSKAVPELIEKWGGKAIKSPVGFVNIRETLMKNKGIMGGEVSGHYCFEKFFGFDSSLMAFLIILSYLSQDMRKVSQIAKEFSLYFRSPELNFKIKEKEEVLQFLKEKYSDGRQDLLDGITVEYPDWWFNARPSNTEPLLRLTVEAKSPEILQERVNELTLFLEKYQKGEVK